MNQNEFLEINCARCEKPLLVRIADVGEARFVECESCAAHPLFNKRQVFVAQGTIAQEITIGRRISGAPRRRDHMGWRDVLLPIVLTEAEIHVLPPANVRTVGVSFILNTFKLAKKNEFSELNVPGGLNGEPLQFIRGHSRTLSAVLSFDGRATNTDVRQPMSRVAELMNVDRQTHAPPVLSFQWRGESLQCILESAVEEFRSVFPDGRPSRGRMHVVFREALTLAQLEQEAGRE